MLGGGLDERAHLPRNVEADADVRLKRSQARPESPHEVQDTDRACEYGKR